MNNQRNLIVALLLSGLLLFGWEAIMSRIYPQPEPVVAEGTSASAAIDGQSNAAPAPGSDSSKGKPKPTRDGGLTDPRDIALEAADLKTALAAPTRVKIDAPEVTGSLNLVGARIDDISLKSQSQTVDKDSGPERLFSPEGTPAQQFAQFGWVGEGVKVPNATTLWTAEGAELTQDSPITLKWDNGEGQQFSITLSIDDQYMFTADQTVTNTSDGTIVVRPFGLVNRTSLTASTDTWNVHSGPIGAFGDAVQYDPDYDDLAEEGEQTPAGKPHWIGFTDIYWLSALVPDENSATADFRSLGKNIYRADLVYQPVTIAAGKQVTRSTRLFVGAKESTVLDAYEDTGIEKFGLAIDWGWFRWFEKPILWLLRSLFGLTGNFGIAIILLTVIVRGMMFPIAQKQFASMAAMKAVQPKMKAIQERYKDDKPKQQQEIMALYKKEGVNPLAGCLPMFLQIPVFFALYKVLMLAIEMRHQPFLYIKDLSAPDPYHILNLFGLLPFQVPAFLGIGILAVLLGVTMYLTFKLNPSTMDPVQQQMFSFMPWVLMFIMAPFAAGLLLYWVTSNLLTLAQQTYLYSRHPQLKAAAAKEKADREAAAARDKAKS